MAPAAWESPQLCKALVWDEAGAKHTRELRDSSLQQLCKTLSQNLLDLGDAQKEGRLSHLARAPGLCSSLLIPGPSAAFLWEGLRSRQCFLSACYIQGMPNRGSRTMREQCPHAHRPRGPPVRWPPMALSHAEFSQQLKPVVPPSVVTQKEVALSLVAVVGC